MGSSNLPISTSQIGLQVLDTSCLSYLYWASPLLFLLPTPSCRCGSPITHHYTPHSSKQQLAPSTLKHSLPREALNLRGTKVCHMPTASLPPSTAWVALSKPHPSLTLDLYPRTEPVPSGSVSNGGHTETPRVQVWCPNFASEFPFYAKVLGSTGQ